MKTKVNPSGHSIRPISFSFFLNERYIDISLIIEIYSTPNKATFPVNFLWDTQVTFEFS
jgi:hypothetical protein